MTTTQQPATAQTQPVKEEHSGTPRWVKIVMAVIFYSGLTVFLLGSIDHVAWFFHLYEPQSTPGDWWALVPSYGKAGALDLAIFFLAYVAATGQTADKVLTWTFTIILSCVSLYANYVYAMFFSPLHQHDIWSIQILFGVTTTGWLSPLIASSYPLFAIVFMYLIERVISRKAETPEQMRQRLQTLKEKKEIERQIKEVEGPGFIQRAKNSALEVKSAAVEVLKNEQKQPQIVAEMATEMTAESAPTLQQTSPVLSRDPKAEMNEDKLALTLELLQKNTQITDEELADFLHLKRPASARFWRLKANEILHNNGSIFEPKPKAKITGELPITDPEIEAVELPQDEEEQHTPDQPTQADSEDTSEMKNSSANQPQNSPKKLVSGLLYRQAARLPICEQKQITAADIRSAVRSKSLRTYSDGSVSKSAVEVWAKTYQKPLEKVS